MYADHDKKIFRIKTSSDMILCVNRENNYLFSCDRDVADNYDVVFGMEIPDMDHYIFLITEKIGTIDVIAEDSKSKVVPVRKIPSDGDDSSFHLESVRRRGLFLGSTPGNPELKAGHIEGNREHKGPWECFGIEYCEKTPGAVDAAFAEIGSIFSGGISHKKVAEYINNYEGNHLEVPLDATVPFLSCEDMENISLNTKLNPRMVDIIKTRLGNDIWAQKAIPSLLSWNEGREKNGFSSVATTYVCPAEESFLAGAGSDGQFVSFFHKLNFFLRKSVTPKRNICILTTVRNEGIYLLEWIAYHRALGVEWFFVYSNDNDDSSDVLLQSLVENGIITWIQNPADGKVGVQFKAYGHALSVMPDILEYKWCFLIDSDEFISINYEEFDTIGDYIKWIEYWNSDCIALNWKFLASSDGPSNRMEDIFRPLTKRSTRYVSHGAIGEGWRLVKSVFRPHHVITSTAHYPCGSKAYPIISRLSNGDLHLYKNPPAGMHPDPGFSDRAHFDMIFISHYFFKSMPEWAWKYSRNGGAFSSSELDTARFDNSWADYFELQRIDPCVDEDVYVRKQSGRHDREMEKLRSVEGIKASEAIVRDAFLRRMEKVKQVIVRDDIRGKVKEKYHYLVDGILSSS